MQKSPNLWLTPIWFQIFWHLLSNGAFFNFWLIDSVNLTHFWNFVFAIYALFFRFFQTGKQNLPTFSLLESMTPNTFSFAQSSLLLNISAWTNGLVSSFILHIYSFLFTLTIIIINCLYQHHWHDPWPRVVTRYSSSCSSCSSRWNLGIYSQFWLAGFVNFHGVGLSFRGVGQPVFFRGAGRTSLISTMTGICQKTIITIMSIINLTTMSRYRVETALTTLASAPPPRLNLVKYSTNSIKLDIKLNC